MTNPEMCRQKIGIWSPFHHTITSSFRFQRERRAEIRRQKIGIWSPFHHTITSSFRFQRERRALFWPLIFVHSFGHFVVRSRLVARTSCRVSTLRSQQPPSRHSRRSTDLDGLRSTRLHSRSTHIPAKKKPGERRETDRQEICCTSLTHPNHPPRRIP
jgi:hypothetical protein